MPRKSKKTTKKLSHLRCSYCGKPNATHASVQGYTICVKCFESARDARNAEMKDMEIDLTDSTYCNGCKKAWKDSAEVKLFGSSANTTGVFLNGNIFLCPRCVGPVAHEAIQNERKRVVAHLNNFWMAIHDGKTMPPCEYGPDCCEACYMRAAITEGKPVLSDKAFKTSMKRRDKAMALHTAKINRIAAAKLKREAGEKKVVSAAKKSKPTSGKKSKARP